MLSRRSFLGGSLAAGIAPFTRAQAIESSPTVLRLERRSIEVNGKSASVLGIRQPNGQFGIATEIGKPFHVRVENRLSEPSLIHWHGLTPPWRQDGVPGVSAPPIPAGGSADYDFPLTFGGTYWMHSHEGLQEQVLLAAPLIIHGGADRADEQDIVLMLADFSFTPPEEIFKRLRNGGGMAAMNGAAKSPAMMGANPGMAMPKAAAKPDLNDVKYDAFLANERTLADPEVVKVEPGRSALLRVINSSSMSAFHIDLGQLKGDLIAVDGHRITPLKGRSFPIAVSQRLDIRLAIPRRAAAYPVLARLEGERRQTGLILVAGRGHVRRAPELADAASPPLTLELESRLRAAEPLKAREADRSHTLNLTGEMAGYRWSINGVEWTEETPPLPVAEGERVELIFVNKTAMPHPMHLHGHVFQVVAINGNRFAGAMRDSLLVPPETSVTVAFDANNPGWWAVHCHLLYHLAAGMFTTIRYV
ncbi:multicopper oxidase domain-containing protein [Methylocapsa polymorpha]|uniref:Multicopper oxidase domain-containing protein n=1 Tax=Methylocapsa polymorpha TaxID=3080828 RepID=A0ABZ0HRV0_9HYPH|nr:multicopper oxidase domain-containing protein [Methylocapsa sp. RX1]